jgi:hypothetical protein
MSAIQIIELIVFIVIVAGILGYLFQSGKNTQDQEPYIKPAYTQEELENIKLAEELYNKDLRPIVVQAAPSIANDIEPVKPQAAAKKPKAKPVVDIEVIEPEFVPVGLSRIPVAPEFADKVEDVTKVFPGDAVINTEGVQEKVKETKSEFPIDKPKKKRKYHPKAKK